MTKRMSGVIILGFVAMVIGSCEKKEAPLLDREEARAVISTYLENPQYDVKISVDIEHESPLIADVVGFYQDKSIAVKYGTEFISTAPEVSSNIDYFLEFPPGDERFVGSAMESLRYAGFAPVLSRREDLGTIAPFQAIRGSFRVRSASEGECRIDDQGDISRATFELEHNRGEMFAIPTNSGFGLREGEYRVVCSFSNEESLSVDELLVAHFAVSKYDAPQYKDGLKSMYCALDTEVRLDAHFTPERAVFDIVYYRDNREMKSNLFECYDIGWCAVKAIATDENGVKAESPEVRIEVTPVPEEFWEGMGMLE